MELKIKRLNDKAIMPIRAHEGDAGLDLTCTEITTEINECGQLILVYHTGLAMTLPTGCVGLLVPRSSICKKSLMQCNSCGILDESYTGEVMFKMKSTTDVVPAVYKVGERIGQLVIVPYYTPTITEVTELENTARGEGGFGSTDTAEAATNSAELASDAPQAAEPISSEQAQ